MQIHRCERRRHDWQHRSNLHPSLCGLHRTWFKRREQETERNLEQHYRKTSPTMGHAEGFFLALDAFRVTGYRPYNRDAIRLHHWRVVCVRVDLSLSNAVVLWLGKTGISGQTEGRRRSKSQVCMIWLTALRWLRFSLTLFVSLCALTNFHLRHSYSSTFLRILHKSSFATISPYRPNATPSAVPLRSAHRKTCSN